VTPDIDRDCLETRLRQARADLERRIHVGEDCRAEAYFAACPELAANVDAAIDLIYTEFAAREEAGRRLPPENYYRRFPQWRDELEKQFAIHELDEPTSPQVIRILGPDGRQELYHFLREISRSPNGNIVKARHLRLNRLVAVKKFAGGDQADIERFQIGAREQKRLQHPNILPVYDVGESEDGSPCFAMEFAEGGSLDQRIAGKPQPPDAAARLVRTLAEAMHYAHREGIVHRDLKPANILLTADDTLQITDLGLARRQDAADGPSKTGEIMGTPPYMAPEQAAGRTNEVGPHSDIYALGAILYELLTGRPPFLAKTALESLRQVLTCRPKRPRRLVRGVPRALESICLKCLEKNPRRRYRSAQALADDLGRWLDHERPQADRSLARSGRFLRGHPVLDATAVLLVLAAVSTPLSFYLADPERERQRIERELKEGKEVILIGENGPPRWHEWATKDPSQKAFLKSGFFCVDSWELALLELVRDPQAPCNYSFSTWVRHDTTVGEYGTVGIYFAHSRHTPRRGVEHILCTVKINGLVDERLSNPNMEGNTVSLRVERYPELTWAGNRATVGLPVYFPVSRTERGVWRKIAMEVWPEKIRVTIWRDTQLGMESKSREVSLREVEQVKDRVCRRLGQAENDPPEVVPALALRGSLGLYVYKGSASYCNTAIRPRLD
jgi:serine/threonine-protein kinase